MIPFYLKFTDEQSALDALAAHPNLIADHIGTITKVIDEETTEVIEGHHVNILAESLPDDLAEFQLIGISTPYRVFAGY